MNSKNDKKAFWSTLPGILTAIATVITAIGGIIAVVVNRPPTVAPTATAPPIVSPTATPVPPRPTDTPTPEEPSPTPEEPSPTSTPSCPAVTGPFERVWKLVQGTIGCATTDPSSRFIAEENFEGGKMFWREVIDYGQVLVLINVGMWQIVKHSPFVEGSPEFSCPDANTPSECPPTPKRGFGMVWCDTPEIRSRLGNATDCERGYQGETQQFQRGFMLQTDRQAIYVFYDDGSWERR